MNQLTESQPSSGSGSGNCKTCSWKPLTETATHVTEQCSNCKQTRTTPKQALNEAQGKSKLLLEG